MRPPVSVGCIRGKYAKPPAQCEANRAPSSTAHSGQTKKAGNQRRPAACSSLRGKGSLRCIGTKENRRERLGSRTSCSPQNPAQSSPALRGGVVPIKRKSVSGSIDSFVIFPSTAPRLCPRWNRSASLRRAGRSTRADPSGAPKPLKTPQRHQSDAAVDFDIYGNGSAPRLPCCEIHRSSCLLYQPGIASYWRSGPMYHRRRIPYRPDIA